MPPGHPCLRRCEPRRLQCLTVFRLDLLLPEHACAACPHPEWMIVAPYWLLEHSLIPALNPLSLSDPAYF